MADNRAAEFLDRRNAITLERMPEGEVRADEEPFVGAGAENRFHRTGRRAVGIPRPVDARRRTGLAGKVRGSGADQDDLVARARDLHDGKSDRGICDISDDIDVLDIKPSAHDGRTDVRLVLVVRRKDFDGPAVDREAELLRRHASRLDRSTTGGAGKRPIHVGDDSDLDDAARRFVSAPVRQLPAAIAKFRHNARGSLDMDMANSLPRF